MYNTVRGGYANKRGSQSCYGVHFPTAIANIVGWLSGAGKMAFD